MRKIVAGTIHKERRTAKAALARLYVRGPCRPQDPATPSVIYPGRIIAKPFRLPFRTPFFPQGGALGCYRVAPSARTTLNLTCRLPSGCGPFRSNPIFRVLRGLRAQDNSDRKPSAREATPLRNEVEQAKNKIWSVGNRFPQFSGPGPAPRGSDDLTSAFADRRADPIHPNY